MHNLYLDIQTPMQSAHGARLLQIKTQIQAGSITAISGPSGAGKSTLLRLIAGLNTPQQGAIRYGDQCWFNGKTRVATRHRHVGMVFQDYALFPNLTVRAQLAYAQQQRNDAQVDQLIEQMGLQQLASRKPEQLSGGQQQRVALARSLAAEPKILLLDEALSALDRSLRDELQQLLLNWQAQSGAMLIVASHDLGEIFRLASRVIQLENGQIVADGTPAAVLLPQRASGRLQLMGTLLAIESAGVAALLTVACGNETVATLVSPEEAARYRVGQSISLTISAANACVSAVN